MQPLRPQQRRPARTSTVYAASTATISRDTSDETAPERTTPPRTAPVRDRATEPDGRVWLAITVLAVAAVLVVTALGAAAHPAVTTATWRATAPIETVAATPSATATPNLTIPATYTPPGAPPGPDWPSSGQAALQITGLGSLGATPDQRPVPIASVTKVMTAYLVLRDHPLTTTSSGPSITVTDAEAAAYPSQVAKGESLVKVTAGEVLTERQALEALLLPSADNVALILARWDAGSVDAFLDKMNDTAESLGMDDTHYTDPSGLAADTRSTANDQVILAGKAVQSSAFTHIVALSSATIPVAGTIHNVNTDLGDDGIDGIKTGSTSAAGGCLLFSAHHSVDGHTVTIVGAVFGQHGSTMYGLPIALADSRSLVETAVRAVKTYTPVTAGQTVATVGDVNLVADHTITVTGWPGLTYTIRLHADPDPRPGAPAGTLDVDGPDGHQSTTLTAGQ